MNAVAVANAPVTVADLSSWSDEAILNAVNGLLSDRGRVIDRLAPYYIVGFTRGIVDRHPLHDWMQAVADGRLVGILLEKLNHRPRSLHHLMKLPINEQRKIACGQKYPVATDAGEKSLSVFQMDPCQVEQVFKNGRVVGVEQQGVTISKTVSVPPLPVVPTTFELKPVRRQADATPPVELRGEQLEKAGCQLVTSILWGEEFSALQNAAKRAGLTVSEFVRRSVREKLGLD